MDAAEYDRQVAELDAAEARLSEALADLRVQKMVLWLEGDDILEVKARRKSFADLAIKELFDGPEVMT